jgi:Uma2 family endonuclease
MCARAIEPDVADVASADADQRIVLRNVTWAQYEALIAMFGDDQPGVRVSYLEGTLELMSPGRRHELIKKALARLVEAYAVERNVPLTGLGQATFRKAAKERGVEPDECWFLGDHEGRDAPDIAFEVVITTSAVDRLALYAGLAVPEVWFWRPGRFSIHRLTGHAYERRSHSEFLPGLDFTLIATLVERRDQTAAVREYVTALRGRG